MVRETSLETYNKIKQNGLLSKRRLEVYEAIYIYGPITIAQIVKLRCPDPRNTSSWSSRTSELKRMGVIAEAYIAPCPTNGNNAIHWVTTDKLPVKLPPTKTNKQIIKELREENQLLKDVVMFHAASSVEDAIEDFFKTMSYYQPSSKHETNN